MLFRSGLAGGASGSGAFETAAAGLGPPGGHAASGGGPVLGVVTDDADLVAFAVAENRPRRNRSPPRDKRKGGSADPPHTMVGNTPGSVAAGGRAPLPVRRSEERLQPGLRPADDSALRLINYWTMGSLGGASWDNIKQASPLLLLSLIGLWRLKEPMNLLLIGESQAQYLGVDTSKLKLYVIILVALGVGAVVLVYTCHLALCMMQYVHIHVAIRLVYVIST